jgi:hypothetical protein
MYAFGITTNVVGPNLTQARCIRLQYYVKKFVSDLGQVRGFLNAKIVEKNIQL